MQINLVTFIAFLLFIAAIAKSSQIWLHEWLLDAMEGPTPVSALIHAATMVTAGVFLIIRFSFIFEYSPLMMSTLLIFGSLTTIFGCIIGAIQYDLKKIIAGSTCSQLGLMMCACATTQYSLAIFHLFTHGFFKALLFLAAGCIIHALQNEQDIRKMGGLAKPLPLSYISILIGSLALSGSPYTDGFFSKDLIVETSYVIISIQGTFFDCLDSLATITSTLYSIQLLYFLFLREYEGSKIILTKATDGPIFMMIPLIILNICSLFIGYMFGELFILRNFTLLNNNPIYYTITNKYFTDVEYTSQSNYIYLLLLIIIGAIFIQSHVPDRGSKDLHTKFRFFRTSNVLTSIIFIKKWLFDLFINKILVTNTLFFYYNMSLKLIDKGFLEKIGPL